jgi:DNA-binding transcriptional LysR family regulator
MGSLLAPKRRIKWHIHASLFNKSDQLMDRVHHLRVFVRVAACGSFSQAADQLGMARGGVSTAVQQLESWLGTQLLHRTTRRVTLTQDGATVLNRAMALVTDMDDLQQQFRPGVQGITGRVRVDMPTRIARRFVAPALPEFLALYPGIEVELGATDRAIDLALEGVDCALRAGPLASTNLVATSLGSFALINCASPAYLARHGVPQGPVDLDQHVCVHYVSPSTGRAAPWEWVEDGVLKMRQLPGSASANNAEVYIACALAGLGMVQIPRFDVQDHLARGELVELMPQALPPPLPVHLVYPSRHQRTRRVKAFTGWLEGVLGAHLHGGSERAPASPGASHG